LDVQVPVSAGWLGVFTELKNRGMQNCFIACIDGLKGLSEAFATVFRGPERNCASFTK
jgi:transposase-like protein